MDMPAAQTINPYPSMSFSKSMGLPLGSQTMISKSVIESPIQSVLLILGRRRLARLLTRFAFENTTSIATSAKLLG